MTEYDFHEIRNSVKTFLHTAIHFMTTLTVMHLLYAQSLKVLKEEMPSYVTKFILHKTEFFVTSYVILNSYLYRLLKSSNLKPRRVLKYNKALHSFILLRLGISMFGHFLN